MDCQAPLSMGFSKHWSELPIPSPGDVLDPGIEPQCPASQVDSLPSELLDPIHLFILATDSESRVPTTGPPGKSQSIIF